MSMAIEQATAIRPDPADRRCLAVVLGVLGLLYALQVTPNWCSGPDTAFYLSSARALALGKGYMFNGGAVGVQPPGWAVALALLMKVSPQFVFLNAVNACFVLFSAGIWYRVLRRLASPGVAMGAMLITGTLFWWYTSSNQLRTEGFFSAVFAPTLLLALQIAEGRRQKWRIALMLAGCAAMVMVRYAGLAAVAVIVGALLSGVRLRRDRATLRMMLVPALALAVTVGSFYGTRLLMRYVLPRFIDTQSPEEQVPGTKIMGNAEKESSETPELESVLGSGRISTYALQSMEAGQWLASLLWMPLQTAISKPALMLVVNLFGWIFVAIFLYAAVKSGQARNYMMLGVALYCWSIIARWGSIESRYLMPVAPLLVLGVLLGFGFLRSAGRRGAGVFRIAGAVAVGSILLTNLSLYAVDCYIVHSGRFYELSSAGELQQLISAASFLRKEPPSEGWLATNWKIVNTVNRPRNNGYTLRGLVLLTGREVTFVPNSFESNQFVRAKKKEHTRPRPALRPGVPMEQQALLAVIGALREGRPDNPAVAEYCRRRHIRYYVYRPPGSHAWHFKKSQLPAFLVGKPKPGDDAAWAIYELKDNRLVPVSFPLISNWPKRVPGL